MAFESTPIKTENGAVKWFIPCEYALVIGPIDYETCNGEQEIDSFNNNGSTTLDIYGGSGSTAKLIAESLLDPQKRDTLHIVVK
jgi:hypothetical protein